jgi:hypothetical protein
MVNSSCLHRTYIFTLDSLGSRHPKVSKVLARYLRLEAVDKKGLPLEETCDAQYQYVSVGIFSVID